MNNLSIIVAIAKNNGIGKDNQLLYWLPNDLKRFKALTTGHTVIMGRKTFDSLPKGALPNRRNIVLSRQDGLVCAGAECFTSLEEALAHCNAEEEIFIMGGASVYKEALPLTHRLYITLVHDTDKQADAATIGYVPKFHDSVKYTGWLRDTILSTDDTIVYLPSEEKET